MNATVKTFADLFELWLKFNQLITVNVDSRPCLADEWSPRKGVVFPASTPVEDVWSWFEAQRSDFVVKDLIGKQPVLVWVEGKVKRNRHLRLSLLTVRFDDERIASICTEAFYDRRGIDLRRDCIESKIFSVCVPAGIKPVYIPIKVSPVEAVA